MLRKHTRNHINFMLVGCIIAALVALAGVSAWSVHETLAYAKEIGQKNQAAKQYCEAVLANNAPAGYTSVLGDASVFRGGDSLSRWDNQNGWWNGAYLDHDSNDFAKPLPYGNTYIDTSKLNWTNSSGFIIDIQDDRFKWVSTNQLTDAQNHTSTDDPMGQGKGFSGADAIYYVGELHSYLPNTTDAARDIDEETQDSNGNWIGPNKIEPQNGAPYLYRITYLNAVTLPDGTKGNLQLTMEKMQIESSFTTNAANPYVTPNGDSYDKAIIRVQGTNELALTTNMKDGAGSSLNPREFVAITAADATQIRSDVNSRLPNNQQLGDDSWDVDKKFRNAVGGIFDLGIVVLDQDGNARPGTVSYAAHDLDLSSAEGIWGRPITKNTAGTYDTKFGEGMKIVSGSLSYALTPKYEHDYNRNGNEPTTQEYGWVERGPFELRDPNGPDKVSPLSITRDTAGANAGPADGVRFSSSYVTNFRDKNGTFANALFNVSEIRTLQNNTAGNGQLGHANLDDEPLGNNMKKLVFGMMKRDGFASAPPTWQEVTTTLAYKYLGDASWKTDHNDSDLSFDTGFAVLLDAAGSKLQWSASRLADAAISTKLFDSTMYTYVETTHGTGGGIYLETYDMQNSCSPVMTESTVTMGRGQDSTVTAVPEDGYRVSRILVGNTNYGKGSAETGLTDYTEYVIEGNDIKVNGTVVGTFSGSDEVADNPGMKTGVVEVDGFKFITFDTGELDEDDKPIITHPREDITAKIRIERNADGTVDVTMPEVDDPMHVHVDFDADYYFYKVWKDGEPTSLNMTAAPSGFYPTEVTIPMPTGERDTEGAAIYEDVTFTIDGGSYTAQGGTYNGMDLTGYVFALNPSNLIEYVETDPSTGEDTLRITSVVQLQGNEFVHPTTGEEYPLTMEDRVADWDNTEVTKEFIVDDTDNYTGSGYVTVLDESNTISPGNIVWKIKYPSAGVPSLQWPALPVEKAPEPDNHEARNHVERNYWFVTEEVPGWATESYDNEDAEIPGRKTDTKYHNAVWYADTIKDIDHAEDLVHGKHMNEYAFLSVFENGGEITNTPAVVVRGVKEWKNDLENAFETRQDIWLHIDAKVNGTEIKDVLPPQKIAAEATGADLIKSWGEQKAYDTSDTNVKVVASVKKVPTSARLQPNGSYKRGNTVYWVNELRKTDAEGNVYEYSIRETLDKEGNTPVAKDNENEGLLGYTSEDVADWTELSAERTADTEGLSGEDRYPIPNTDPQEYMPRYTGTVENTLETVDFTVTKIWKENGATGDGRTHDASTLDADVAKLKGAYTLKESGETIADTSQLALQPSTAADYVPASGSTPASGTLETAEGDAVDGNPTTVFTWHNIPLYVGGTDGVHKAVYSIVESTLNGYVAPKYDNSETDAEGKAGETDAAYNNGTITNEVLPPDGKDKETYGPKNSPQSTNGKNMFMVKTDTDIEGNANEIVEVKLVDPTTGQPTTSVTVPEGTYTIDDDGKIIFEPNTDFVGDPTPVDVIATDANGLTATAQYQPHIIDNEQIVKRTITYEYSNGDPVLDGEGNPLTVEQSVTFTGTVHPDTGEVTWDSESKTMDQVDSDDIEGYTVDKENVPTVTVYPTSDDLFEKVIYSPKGVSATPDETYGLPGQPQTGTVTFTMETETYTDGTPNTLTVKLIDPATGEETDEKTVSIPGQGTYTLNDDGTITFTPEDGYVGNPDPIEVTGTDRFGTKAKTTYTPHIVDPTLQDTATRTVHFTYLTEDGEEVTDDVTQTVTLTRHASSVDPKTGEVLEWGPWEPASFPAVKNPDDKVDGRVWFTDDEAGELEVTEPGDKGVTYIVYEKIPYTVTYVNGDHGKSDGKGDQTGEDYGNEVTGGNGVTPDKGYKFTGRYTYVITDHDGNVIGEGSTDDPTSIEITGNIVFTPEYEPLPRYNINYDPNGGTGKMDDNNYASDDETMPFDDNTFTRDKHTFEGFYAYITDPRTGKETPIVDEAGNPILFTGSEDMSAYFKDMPDGTSIRMEAQWKPVDEPAPEPEPEPEPSPTPAPTPDPNPTPDPKDPAKPTPKASKGTTQTPGVVKKLAATGDEAPIVPLAGIALLAGAALLGTGLARRVKR